MTHAQLEREHVHTVKWHYYSVSRLNSSERKSPLLQKVEVASVLLLLTGVLEAYFRWSGHGCSSHIHTDVHTEACPGSIFNTGICLWA